MHPLILSTLPVTLASAAPGSGLAVGSVFELVLKGGWIMVPIGICSLVALTIIVERLIVLRRAQIAPPELLGAIPTWRDDARALLERCERDPSPLAAVLVAAASAADESRETRDRLIEEAGQRQILLLRRRVRLLSVMPQVATMLGLLGTVVGMIRTFTVVAASGDSLGKTERLAQGIYEAWTATAAGIAVAIPTMIAYHLILSRIDAAAALLDASVTQWAHRPRTSVQPAVPAPLPVNQPAMSAAPSAA